MDQDAALMLEFTKGDISAFEEIMRKYKSRIINIAYRFSQDYFLSEDIAHEVFIKMYNSANTYKPRAKLFTWIYRITVNSCLNALRPEKRIKTVSLEKAAEIVDTAQPDPADRLERDKMEQLVKKAVSGLPERQRLAVILQKYDGLSYHEIAHIMDCPVSAVDSLLQRAKQKLKKELAPFYQKKNEGLS